MLIIQSATNPTRIRNALVDLIAQGVVELHVASAYVTESGSRILLDQIRGVIGARAFDALPKRLVASLDYGLTQPEALRYWKSLGACTVHAAGAEAIRSGRLTPAGRAFHPKMYLFKRTESESGLLVGSANLTVRGLAVNTEAAWREDRASSAEAMTAFEQILKDAEPVDDTLIDQYERLKRQQPTPREIRQEVEPVEPPAPVNAHGRPEFRSLVENGRLDPSKFDRMWVQGEGLQGGSGNQLELPRQGHRFFGFIFDEYGNPRNVTIGNLTIRMPGHAWDGRLLTWHGNNRMERLNLPTLHQGGVNYTGMAVMFRRLPDESFELTVVPWDSDMARAWRQASAERDLLFRLGRNGNRLVGLL